MNHRRLGRTGLKISEIGPGTMTFVGQCDEATSVEILRPGDQPRGDVPRHGPRDLVLDDEARAACEALW